MGLLTDQRDEKDEIVIDSDDYDDVTEETQELETEIGNIIAEFGDEAANSAYLKVYRSIKNTGNWEHLFDCLPGELPLQDRLHSEYGGGHYQARLYIKKERRGTGKPAKTMVRKFDMYLGEPKQPPLMKQDSGKELVTVMIEGFNRLGDLIAAQRTAQPATDPVAMQTSLLNNMVLMKQILAPDTPQNGGGDSIKQLNELLEVQKKLSDLNPAGGADSNSVLMGLMNNVLPQLAEMGKQEQQLKAQDQQRRRVLAAKGRQPLPTGTAQPAPPQTETQDTAAMILKPHIVFLTTMAANNHDPETYARMVIDNTPVDQLPDLIEFVASPTALDDIAAIYKPAGNYRGWFRDLGQCVLYLTQAEPGENIEPAKTQGVFAPPGVVVGSQYFTVGDNVPGQQADIGPTGENTDNPPIDGDT